MCKVDVGLRDARTPSDEHGSCQKVSVNGAKSSNRVLGASIESPGGGQSPSLWSNEVQ